MPDPIRVTRAVRRVSGPCKPDTTTTYTTDPPQHRCKNCGNLHVAGNPPRRCPGSDGWVDVPVDEECPTCRGVGFIYTSGGVWSGKDGVPHVRSDGHDCPDCGGSGRRLHNWATGWYWGDTFLWRGRGPFAIGKTIDYTNWPLMEQCATLVLSDPSHRPEPMRWKQ